MFKSIPQNSTISENLQISSGPAQEHLMPDVLIMCLSCGVALQLLDANWGSFNMQLLTFGVSLTQVLICSVSECSAIP